MLKTRVKPETKPALELTYTQEFKTELGEHCIKRLSSHSNCAILTFKTELGMDRKKN